jgi:uncharacterized protein (AIM24 family)
MEETSASLLRRARELYEEDRVEEAEVLLGEALPRFPSDPGIRTFHAYLLYRTGRLGEAADAYRRLADEFPEEESHLSNLGLIYLKEKKFVEARETFESLLRLRPGDAKALRNLAFCHRRLGNEKRARERFHLAGEDGAVKGAPEEGDLRSREREEGSASSPEATPLETWITEAALPLHSRGGEIFHSSPGSAVCCIDEKVFLKRRHLFAYRGVIVFSSASLEARKAALKFGDRESELIRVEGTGEIGLSARGGKLYFFHLGEGKTFSVNFASLVSHGPEIEVSYGSDGIFRRVFLEARLSGPGGFVLAAAGDPVVLEVPEDMPAFVRAGSVLGWTGDLVYNREDGPASSGFLRRGKKGEYLLFEGRGYLVLQDRRPGEAG